MQYAHTQKNPECSIVTALPFYTNRLKVAVCKIFLFLTLLSIM